VEVADRGGDPRPARGARPLSLAPSYAVLCAVQAGIVLAAHPPARGRAPNTVFLAGLALPVAALGAGIAVLRLVAGGPHALAVLGAVGTPLLAAAGRRRLPLAAALWLVAWLTHGLVREAAEVALVALAAVTVARLVSCVAPAWSIAAGLVAIAVVDVVLVWGTRQVQPATSALHHASLPAPAGHIVPALQDATFGSATMGWLDLLAPALLGTIARTRLRAAAATGLAAGAFGLLLFVTPTVPATVPVLAGLALAGADRRHLRRPREPRRARVGPRIDRHRPA
jgi:hypothetical protein